MDSFTSYIFRQAYEKVNRKGDRLAKIKQAVDWEAFRPIIKAMYRNDTPQGGRPNTDEVLMVKLLVLQQWYGLSDPELEKQALNRLDFQHFLGWPEQPPDYSTVWQFRERLASTGTDSLIWAELQRQLDEKGLRVRKGVAQDASFIEADPGPSGKPRGDEAATRRSRDGDWAKRLKESFFGFKLHVKTDLDLGLIRAMEVSSASVHDSRVDLSELGEVVYRDKGYFGVEPRGWDATMKRGVRGHPLGDADRLRNRRIGLKRRPVERVFAVIKRVFHGGRVLVTSLPRVRVKMVFSCLCFNLLQLGSLGVVP
ncbi:IS5 family transposase [Candidatus Bathyarchaeota archaeon]|nr:IS5 family transposase [Candidatus Bathyarchaeota archaeon]